MTRKEELLKYICTDEKEKLIIENVVDELLFLEERLERLKKLPFIKIDPSNQERQKATPAAKQYKELLQQYMNIVKVLTRVSGTGEADEESPLRKWVKAHVNSSE